MPNPIPESELPPISPDRHFFYCPDPLLMTDEEVEMIFPRENRIAFLRELAHQPSQPTPQRAAAPEGIANGR